MALFYFGSKTYVPLYLVSLMVTVIVSSASTIRELTGGVIAMDGFTVLGFRLLE